MLSLGGSDLIFIIATEIEPFVNILLTTENSLEMKRRTRQLCVIEGDLLVFTGIRICTLCIASLASTVQIVHEYKVSL